MTRRLEINTAFLACTAIAALFLAGCRSDSNCRARQRYGGESIPRPTMQQVPEQGEQGHAGVTAAPHDGQKTCPVTGEELGAHGAAIPVNIHGQTIYVCCRGCVAKVKASPEKYLAIVNAERNER